MFFNFSSRKILVISILFGLLFLGAITSFFINDHYKVGQGFDLYARKISENVRYWWSNKVFGGTNAEFVDYQGDGKEARSVPVLIYHGLPDEGGGENPFSTVQFSEQMETLKRNGWQTITLEQFERFIRGDLKLAEKSFLLTFDDGRKDTFYPSDPILKDLGMHAVMFAITKKSIYPTKDQSPYYLSPYELNAMEKSKEWEVQSHGRDSHDWYYVDDKANIGHFFSNLLWLSNEGRLETEEEFRGRVIYDLSNSKTDLEITLNKEIIAFAFPFSDYGQDTSNFEKSTIILREEVSKFYKLAFYQVWSNSGENFNYPSATEVMMKRIEPRSGWTGEDLLNVMESGLTKDLPYSQTTFGDEWISNWGSVVKSDQIAMSAEKSTTGASTALNGSWWWPDHTLKTDVQWASGSNLVLIGRRIDDDNYLGCNFGRNKVYIKTVTDGKSFNLLEVNYKVPANNQKVNLGIDIKGSTIRCLVNNQSILEGSGINHKINNGGIGLEIWDNKEGVAKATFDNIEVTTN